MLMPENNWQSGLSRYGFNGHENDNEIKGTGNHIAFGDYGYDTRLGRRWNQDPVVKHHLSSYLTFSGNPISRIDPDGKEDFWTESGKKVGTDGVEDGKHSILKDKDDIKKAKESYFGKGIVGWFRSLVGWGGKGYIERQEFNGEIVDIPEKVVREAIRQALIASNVDGYHEEGGVWGGTENGETIVSPSKPGNETKPDSEVQAKINLMDPQNPELLESIKNNLKGSYHIHPSGVVNKYKNLDDGRLQVTTHSFDQPPSSISQDGKLSDLDVARLGTRTTVNIVVGAKDKKIYFYTGNETGKPYHTKFPLKTFLELDK